MASFAFDPYATSFNNTVDNSIKDVEIKFKKKSVSDSLEVFHNCRDFIEEDVQSIPRSVYLNSKFKHTNLGKVRDMLRSN